ncbi:flippase [Geitlerinema calcuttense]|uniref:Flippase n=1 Tax=Geitlerinema calcuttense NRMC-F 0142 TaxID=2922238 RepID=A0ABT7LYI6_9CYAN|nr:flippase [Geitlerinema calcuttense]MDL5057064.1 flippase [Geitlerinema calcuttense NRMC-F 0142]
MLNKIVRSRQELSPESRKIIHNTGWLFASKIGRMFVSLFVATWVARYLGPNQFGTLQYALAFSGFFMPLSTGQMGPIITRELVRRPEHRSIILGTAFILQLLGGMVAASLCVVGIFILAPSNSLIRILVFIVSLKFFLNSLQPIENWFESQVNSKFTVFAEHLSFLVISAIKCGLIIWQAPLVAFAIVIILEALLYGLFLIFYYQRDRQSIYNWKGNLQTFKYLLKESFPLLLSSTACVIYINIDKIMLGNMIDSQAVGIYSSASALSEASSFLPLIVCSSLYPAIIQSKNSESSVYQKKMQRFYDSISFLSYSAIALMIPLSGLAIALLYGNSYQAAIPILKIHIWSTLFTFLGIAQSKWIVAEGLQLFNFYSRLAGLISNIALNGLLIPTYGGTGAAIATLISYAIGSYLYFLFIPQTRNNAILMTKAICLPFRLPKMFLSFIHS